MIKEFMIALWENILNDNSEKAELEFQDYFSTIAHFCSDFTTILDIWTASESKAGTKHLANLVVDEKTSIFERKKITGFYDKTENVDELINWILSDKIYEKIQRKFFEFETENFAEKISWAEQIVNRQHKVD